ncbi:MAG: glycosyltransferase family 2 protein [Bacteroidales bacterium]|nr:glycosyltransferase family 2 protein [Bacteroidales bacterium]
MPILFSIIIPHYNIPDLLRRCLDSIPRRDDLEVIVVDDHSDPAIVDFDNLPGRERPDVTILRNDSKGCGSARNKGMEAAKGRWLIFADADDFFTYCLNSMLDKYADSDADIIYFRPLDIDSEYYCRSSGSFARSRDSRRYFDTCIKDKKKGEKLLRYAWAEAWSRMIRHKFVAEAGIRFDDVPINEDVAFGYTTGHMARSVIVEQHCIYAVTSRPNSLSQWESEKLFLSKVDIFGRKERFLRDNTPYTFLNRVDRSHYMAWARLVMNGSEAGRLASGRLKELRLLGPTAYIHFAYYAAKHIAKWLLGRPHPKLN